MGRRVVSNPKKKRNVLTLARVGGLNAYDYKGVDIRRAPERRGMYAFIWPYVDLFYLSGMSSGDRGLLTDKDRERSEAGKIKTRYDQLKLEGFRLFDFTGSLWVKRSIESVGIENVQDFVLDYDEYRVETYVSWIKVSHSVLLNEVVNTCPSYVKMERGSKWMMRNRPYPEVFIGRDQLPKVKYHQPPNRTKKEHDDE